MAYFNDSDDVEEEGGDGGEDELGLPSGDADHGPDNFDRADDAGPRRGVDEAALSGRIALFSGTSLAELLSSVDQLRQLYGPSDPTIADLCEEIQSQMAEFMLGLRRSPLSFIFQVLLNDPSKLDEVKAFVASWERRLAHVRTEPI